MTSPTRTGRRAPGPAAPQTPSALLRRLEELCRTHDAGTAGRKLDLLAALDAPPLPGAPAVHRLHECLCYLRAYPDDRRVLARVERMLDTFADRADLRRHREELADTGIAGTETRYRFTPPTAAWLARRWPGSLSIDWDAFDSPERLETFLPLLVHYGETPGLDEWDYSVRQWLARLKGPGETDATFLVRRLGALPADALTREAVYDSLEIPLRLVPAPGTPSRTRARHTRSPVVFVRRPLQSRRPVLPRDARRRPVRVRDVRGEAAQSLIDLAREAMVARQRDLDVFCHASPDDVRLVEWDDGLQFACFGVVPERRLLLEAVYALLTLKNGVPVGYVLVSALFGSSEIAYNVFDTFRGGESAAIYGQVMSTVRHLFRSDAFTIFPYQLGQDNEEGIASGAWWFYQKIGFLPQSTSALRLMRRELQRMKRDPRHRSSPATLRALADHNLYYFFGRPRRDVIGSDLFPDTGLRISEYLSRRFGSDREEAARVCSQEAAAMLGLPSLAGFSEGERIAWDRWAPLVRILPGLSRWTPVEKRALVAVVRAKGGARESDFAARFDRHHRLRRAILRLTDRTPRRRA